MKKNILSKAFMTTLTLPLAVALTTTSAYADKSIYVAGNIIDTETSDDITYNVAVGKYIADKRMSFEIGYADFGNDAGVVNSANVEVDTHAFQLSAIGYMPLAKEAGLLGRIGVEKIEVDGVVSNDFLSASETIDEINPFFGLGAYYNIGNGLDIRGEVQRHEILDENFTTYSVGLSIETL